MKKIIIITVAFLLIFVGIYLLNKNSELILQGEVEVKSVDLASKIVGRVQKLNVEVGDKVKKGDVLVLLDTPDISAKAEQSSAILDLAISQEEKVFNGARKEQVSAAKSTMDLAKKTYDRINRLNKEGVLPAQKLDEAYAKYKVASDNYTALATGSRIEDKVSAKANVRRAKGVTNEVNSYLKENRIISPINGEIVEVSVEEGELVGSGYPIITVVDNTDNWITFNLREDLLSKITLNKEFDVKIPALGNKKTKVRVNYISVLGNFATWRATKAKGDFDMKTFEVRVVPVQFNPNLRAGMSAVFDWKKLK